MKNYDIFRSWKNRRIWPIFLDYLLGISWAYVFVIAIFVWLANWIFAFDYAYGSLGNPFLHWNGAIVATVCLAQFLVSLVLDRKYDKNLGRLYFWVVWYPVVYWFCNSLAVVVATPKALFKKRKMAVWVSPDRGIRGESKDV